MQLNQLKIGRRLTVGFAFLGLLMLLQGLFALNTMSGMHTITEKIEANALPSLDNIAALNLNVIRMDKRPDRDERWLNVIIRKINSVEVD